MSTVVNGHREDDNTHARPHGHVLPMLSFSASTPTEEENPLDNNPAIAIDMTLWEQPEDATGAGPSIAISNEDDSDEGMNPEAVPLIDVNRDVVLVDGPVDDDEPGENDPLLTGGGGRGGGGGGGGRGCGDISESGFGGLGIPVNMPRRPEDSEKEDGGQHQKLQNGIHSDASVNELRDVASQLVCEVISQAQAQASRSNLNDKVEDRIEDPHSDERLMEIVRRFVSDIMAAAKAEAWDSMREIQNNNNNLVPLKEEDEKEEEKVSLGDPHSDEQLMETVRCFVSDVISAAQKETNESLQQQLQNNNNVVFPHKIEDNRQISDPYSDEHLMDKVRGFVSEVLVAARNETEKSIQQLQNNNNILLAPKVKEKQEQPVTDPYSNEQLMERARSFVSEVMNAARENCERERLSQNNNKLVSPRKAKLKRQREAVDPYEDEELMATVRDFVAGIMNVAHTTYDKSRKKLNKNKKTISFQVDENERIEDRRKDEEVMERARSFVSEVLSAATETERLRQTRKDRVFPEVEEYELIVSDPRSDEELMSKVRSFVSDVMSAAVEKHERRQSQTISNKAMFLKVDERQRVADVRADERLMERVRGFVSDILAAAKETQDKKLQLQIKNGQMEVPAKAEQDLQLYEARSDAKLVEKAHRFVSDVMNAAREKVETRSHEVQGNEKVVMVEKINEEPPNEEMLERARDFVTGVLAEAQEKLQKVGVNAQIADARSDEQLMANVRCFVSDVVAIAQETYERKLLKEGKDEKGLAPKVEGKAVLDAYSDEGLMEKVRSFVSEVIEKALETHENLLQIQNTNNMIYPYQVDVPYPYLVDPYSDEHLIERVGGYVFSIMEGVKAPEPIRSERQMRKSSTMMLFLDEEDAASAAEGTTEEEGGKSKRGPQNLASPASNHAERFFRGGPWYVQMGRVFSAFVSRICPCRCPTKP